MKKMIVHTIEKLNGSGVEPSLVFVQKNLQEILHKSLREPLRVLLILVAVALLAAWARATSTFIVDAAIEQEFLHAGLAAEILSNNDDSSQASLRKGGTQAAGVLFGEEVYASSYIAKKGFPKSYKKRLKKLHKLHPSWKFTPVITNIKWSDAVKRMTADPAVNTLWYAYNDSYKSTDEGFYNYLTDTYSGGSFPAASKQAVKFFMDPRNFLDERNVYMFEDRKYHSYQKESMVKKLVSMNSVLKKNAKYFVQAGKKYNISPLYLASKSYSELGTSGYMMDGHKFTYKGIKYKNCYNAYNIGATDTLGKVGGLIYANGGASKKDYKAGPSTSYGRKWDSPGKAIRGGARFLRKAFIAKKQSTAYTEHFNVMNGLDAVGTHVYMTALNAGISMAGLVSDKYSAYDIDEKPLVFYIPVYKKMPSKPCARPSASTKKDNNYYLKKLVVQYEENGEQVTKRLIKSSVLNYRKTFKINVSSKVRSIKVSAAQACKKNSEKKGAKVSGTGKVMLKKGVNIVKVRCRASTGIVRTYKIKITRG